MELKDKEALKELKRVKSSELEDMIEYYPEDERDGRSDLEMLADEASYMYSCYLEDGHSFHDDLVESRRLLRKTKYGKQIPIDPRTFRPVYGYWPSDIDSAKSTVNEFNRLGRLLKRLQSKGIYGKWHQV